MEIVPLQTEGQGWSCKFTWKNLQNNLQKSSISFPCVQENKIVTSEVPHRNGNWCHIEMEMKLYPPRKSLIKFNKWLGFIKNQDGIKSNRWRPTISTATTISNNKNVIAAANKLSKKKWYGRQMLTKWECISLQKL